jgi:DNA-binding transcriptional LysR family regulator
VRPFDTVASDGKDNWLVYASGRQRLKKVQAFEAWVLEQAARMQGG